MGVEARQGAAASFCGDPDARARTASGVTLAGCVEERRAESPWLGTEGLLAQSPDRLWPELHWSQAVQSLGRGKPQAAAHLPGSWALQAWCGPDGTVNAQGTKPCPAHIARGAAVLCRTASHRSGVRWAGLRSLGEGSAGQDSPSTDAQGAHALWTPRSNRAQVHVRFSTEVRGPKASGKLGSGSVLRGYQSPRIRIDYCEGLRTTIPHLGHAGA